MSTNRLLTSLIVTVTVLIALVAFGLGYIVFGDSTAMQQVKAQALAQQSSAQQQVFLQDKAVELSTKSAVQPAAVLGQQILLIGAGVAGALFLLGLGLAGLALSGWLNKNAWTVKPDEKGQMPMLKLAGPGYVGYVVPDRTTGAGLFRVPTVLDYLLDFLRRASGQEKRPWVESHMPTPLSESGTLTLTGQATMTTIAVAATRKNAPGGRSAVAGILDDMGPGLMPVVPARQISAPASTGVLPIIDVEPSHIQRLLETDTDALRYSA